MIKQSNHATAKKSLVTHSFRPGLGYIDHGATKPIDGQPIFKEADCIPPAVAQDQSEHFLMTPNDGMKMRMRWIQREKAWRKVSGHEGFRMAFSASYLAHNGWKYIGPV